MAGSVPFASLTETERVLLEYAREQLGDLWRARRAKGGVFEDILACVLSDTGGLYAGTPLKPSLRIAGFCAERHAIADMAYHEGPTARIASILVAGPVPSPPAPVTMPCGICRHVIYEFGAPHATVLCASYVLREEGISPFPQLRRFSAVDLYPHPYEPIVWDEWVDT